ncbi:MAG: alcohol dehydrogenase, propanol-preferring [Frankiales bacterium]|jgi:2-desacetyl-2-hydroxyethyl bacteriochlorophyllide A dehydrogenase|nr:alcohol dehydrogenase, propanol-preferring [Frankiales bacterium]
MKAWQFTDVGKPLALNEIPDPEPNADEIVIDIKASGICHSDVGFLDGSLSYLLPFSPFTLGHEIVGFVAEVGSDVTKFAVGDAVVVPAAIEGPGCSLNGGFAAKVTVPERLVIAMPEGIPWDQAATATDAGLTSYHAMIVRGGAQAGSKVGVIGFGGLGSLGAQVALAVGAEVYVAEINETVHDYARNIGVTDVSTSITHFADKDLDVIVDYAGFGTTTAEAVDTVRPGIARRGESTERPGGRVVLVGLPVQMGTIDLHTLILNEVELHGSQSGTLEDCEAVLKLMADGKVASRITQIGFDDIGEGVTMLERGEVVGRLVAILD